MGFGSQYVTSPRTCFSTEDHNEWINKHYHINDDDDDDAKKFRNRFIYFIVMNVKNTYIL